MSEHTTCPETGQPTFIDIDGWRHRDGSRCEHIGRRPVVPASEPDGGTRGD